MPKINIGDINMYYEVFEKGTGKEREAIDPNVPTMIVWHGGFGILDHLLEIPSWSHFSAHAQLIFPDVRGHGQTDYGDPNLWTMDQFGRDVYAFSEALGIRAIHAGVSAGGYALISYGVQFPGHALGLILCNTESEVSVEAKFVAFNALGTRADKSEFAAFQGKSDTEIQAFSLRAAYASMRFDEAPDVAGNWEEFGAACFPLISKKSFELISPASINMNLKKKFANGYRKFSYRSRLSAITSPVLWLAGEYDPLHPLSGAARDVDIMKNAGCNVDFCILKAGDPVYTDASKGFDEAILKFLGGHVR
jgi:pimeloyl-ACP methyl ester carboxylesterase